MQVLLVANDNDVELMGVSDRRDDLPVNDATVTFALTTVGGESRSTGSLTYVPGSDGLYRGTIESNVSLTDGVNYRLTVTATAGTKNGQWVIACIARTRTD